MKRLSLLAVALVMILGMAASASAAPEVKITGNLLVNAVWNSNWDYDDTNTDTSLNIKERADLYFTVTANENLKGVLGLRSDKGEWGGAQFALDTPGGAGSAQMNVRDAYIDFKWPGTDVNIKAGVYTVALPAAVGGSSKIIGERAGAVMVSAPLTDNVSVLAGYTRLYNNNAELGQTDGYLLAAPLSFEGVSATPYFLYANSGVNSQTYLMNYTYDSTGAGNDLLFDDISAYWIGTDFTLSILDPFIIKADLAYGNADATISDQLGTFAALDGEDITASGWLFDLAVDYTGFDFMTVEAFFAYTTGEDDDIEDSERMPVLNSDWAVGSFFFGGGSITSDDLNGGDNVMGFWTVGLSLLDIQSFAEGLTHTVHVLYAQGTNDNDSALVTAVADFGTQLTDEDSLWEVDLNTDYKIYDELTLYTQLGYISADWDDDTWGDTESDAWKVATGVVYKF